ncbi:hypothetical protein, partial [Klebsiella pneumoniae]|uniref:hypothetical protein n=1 Tax=Klebsiella pneumoniae TaxID=573 RepID=UPI002DDD6C5C
MLLKEHPKILAVFGDGARNNQCLVLDRPKTDANSGSATAAVRGEPATVIRIAVQNERPVRIIITDTSGPGIVNVTAQEHALTEILQVCSL